MTGPVSDRKQMIAQMAPVQRPGRYHFCTLKNPADAAGLLAAALASFHEAEGLSLILTEEQAAAAGLSTDHPMACLTLTVHSSLEGVGLTAAVARALADEGIACNMVAAFHHDHAFVPYAKAARALKVLQAAARSAAG